MADLFCSSVQGDFAELFCGTETGRIISLGLVDPSVNDGSPDFDPSDDAAWQAGEAASPRTHWIINGGVRGEMSRASDTEEEGFGLDVSQLTGADHSVTLHVKGIEGNVEWTNIVNKKKWYVALATSAGFMYWIQAPVTVIFRPMVGTDLKSSQYWDVALKWTDIDNPEVFTTVASLEAEV